MSKEVIFIKRMSVPLEYQIPRILWENMESILMAQARNFVKEMAHRLHVPEKDLLRAVLPSHDSVNIVIQDTNHASTQCKAYVQRDKLTIQCKQPTAHLTEFCPVHQRHRTNIIKGGGAIPIQRIKARGDMEPLWVVKETELIRSNGTQAGRIQPNKERILLYQIQEDNDND